MAKTPPACRKLTARQARFVQEYMIDLNGQQAAIRAGYSPKTAVSIASENLSKPNVVQALAELQGKRAKSLDVSAQNVLRELARIAFADLGDVLEWDDKGTLRLKAKKELGADIRAAIREISRSKSGEQKIKLHDKVQALVQLGKHLNLFPDRTEHTGKDGEPIEFRITDIACESFLSGISRLRSQVIRNGEETPPALPG